MKTLYVMVEGNDDERFFNGVFKPEFLTIYDKVQIWQHAQRSNEDKKKIIKAIETLEQDYIYVEDIDDVPEPSRKKNMILNIFDRLERNRIVIVVKEIESWYLAGLDQESCDRLGLDYVEKTEEIYKEDFNELIPLRFRSRINFMHEIIKEYSLSTGMQRNESLNKFVNNFLF